MPERRIFAAVLRHALPLLVVAAALLVQIQDPPFQARMRQNAFDQLQRWHPAPADGGLPLRVVAIDDASLKALGQWPWPRRVLARIVERLGQMGAAVVVFDILFAEPDRHSPEQLAEAFSAQPELRAALAALPAYDDRFADSFEHAPVVLGFAVDGGGGGGAGPPVKTPFLAFGGDARGFLPRHSSHTVPLPLLQAAAAGQGVVSLAPDGDGVVREMPLLFQVGGQLYPSLTLDALRIGLGLDNLTVHVSGASAAGTAGIGALGLGSGLVATNGQGQVRPHFRRLDPHRYVPAVDLLGGAADPALFAGHVVFVGATARGLGDIAYTPLGEVVPGVEAHVQLAERLLDGDLLVRPAWESDLLLALLLGTWALLALLLGRLRPLWSVLAALGIVAGVVAASVALFRAHGVLLDPTWPVVSTTALFLAVVIPRYLNTEREQRWIRDAFSRYVSPNRVRYLQQNHRHLELGGVYRECSFVMSDLEGFTGLMERHDPATLSGLLNEYLDGMIAIAFRHEGTLDRIVGDAVAVMFSAPVEQPDHAARAVACALKMDRFARAFSAARQAEAIPFGRTRIGVNTGTVLVGNFGGRNMLDYRALGDAINVAARLETLNGQLGTHVCVAAATVQQCPAFSGRPIGRFVLKGKSETVEVFEPLPPPEMRAPCVEAYLEAYRLMDEATDDPGAAFRRLSQRCPDDPLARFHGRRAAAGERGNRIEMRRK